MRAVVSRIESKIAFECFVVKPLVNLAFETTMQMLTRYFEIVQHLRNS